MVRVRVTVIVKIKLEINKQNTKIFKKWMDFDRVDFQSISHIYTIEFNCNKKHKVLISLN